MSTKISKHKRSGLHHRFSKDYKQVYWPYIPLLCFSLLIFFISFLPSSIYPSKTLSYSEGLSTSKLLQATNLHRGSNKVNELTLNQSLSDAAQSKANDMITRDYWSHKTPDGQDPWVFLDSAGYKYIRAGENLAYGFKDSDMIIKGWMQSQTHRENMLNSDFTEVGFGFANGTNYRSDGNQTVVVAMYARPESLGATTNQTNSSSSKLSDSNIALTKAQSLFGLPPVFVGIGIGILGGSADTGLFINHSLRLRRFFKKGERYFVAHPILDISLVLLSVATFNLSRVVGYIY